MGLKEVHLHHVAGQFQQTFEISQAPGSMMGGNTGSLFQLSGRMLFG